MTELTPINSIVSLEKQAYDTIREAILSFQLKPGQSLVENDLARQLNISKTPVREALHRLEKEGLVVRYMYRGAFVADLNRQTMVEMFQVRAVLEGLAVRLAVPSLTEPVLAHLEDLIQEHEKRLDTGDLNGVSTANRKFHEAILLHSPNQWLAQTLQNLEDHLRRYRTLSIYQTERRHKSAAEHRRIMEAIRRRDPEAAEAAMKAHLLNVIEDLAEGDFDKLVSKITASIPSPK